MKNLTLLSMGLLIFSCNEKISPELQNGNSTTIPSVNTPDEYYFRVVNSSPVVLNYVLHRTGNGHKSTPCKVTATGYPLSSTLYTGEQATAHDNKFFDMSCYFDVEELSLDFNGLNFKMEASKNTCEYLAYSPYSFYDAIPGNTSVTWVGYECEEGIGPSNWGIATPHQGVDAIGGPVRDITCGEMVDNSLAPANRIIKAIPEDAQPLCAFDYDTNGGGNGQNCDSGRMKFSLTSIYDANPDPVFVTAATRPLSRADHLCKGTTG
ncbi:MAG: hypothetical protein H0V66_03175, partial [Bdellovibrionales bacterium]|nr:hypothetical protein [Bdellovibrionales bacterium]